MKAPLAALLLALAWPASSHAATVVGPGDSIQAAVDAARPGETILVTGTHRENVAVQTDGVALRGRRAVLLAPSTPSPHACFDPTEPGEAVHGVCVIGDVDFDTGEVSRHVEGVSVAGFTIRGFRGAGLVAVGARDTTFARNVVEDSDDGVMVSESIRTRARRNDVSGGRFGARVFNAEGTTIVANSLHDNCVGAFVLGDSRDTRIAHNRIVGNRRACPSDDDFPALSGIGVGLVGAVHTTVVGNRIIANRPGGVTVAAGGVVAVSAPTDSRVHRNRIENNDPDLFWDGTGSGNVFGPNRCGACVDVQRVSGPSPFADGCAGAAFDATMVTGQELEPTIAVDPSDPRRIVATWKQDVGPDSTRSDLIASSLDGGNTWTRTTIPGLSKCTDGTADGASDPWVSAGIDGTVYFTGLAPRFDGDTPLSAVVAARSRDGGRSWSTPTTLAPPADGNEMPAVTASRTRPGRAYAVWAEFATGAIRFARTDDHAAAWSAPVVVDPSITNAIDLVPRLVVLPDGTLVTVFARAEFVSGIGKVYATRSRDGGRTWTAPVELLAQRIETFFDPETGEELPQPQFPNVAVAPDGSIYVTVEANRSATAGDVIVARSRDGGGSWTRVTSPGIGAYAFEPAIAVDSRGTIGVTWYDLRNDRPGDSALSGEVWFASSRDGGASWRETHVAGPTDLRSGALARQNRFGEYQGLAAIGRHGFAAVFTLAAPFATNGPTDVFVARVRP